MAAWQVSEPCFTQSLSTLDCRIKKAILNPESYENYTKFNFPLTQNENETAWSSFEPIQVGSIRSSLRKSDKRIENHWWRHWKLGGLTVLYFLPFGVILGLKKTLTLGLFSSLPNWISSSKWCLRFTLTLILGTCIETYPSEVTEWIVPISKIRHFFLLPTFFVISFFRLIWEMKFFAESPVKTVWNCGISRIISKRTSCAAQLSWFSSVQNPINAILDQNMPDFECLSPEGKFGLFLMGCDVGVTKLPKASWNLHIFLVVFKPIFVSIRQRHVLKVFPNINSSPGTSFRWIFPGKYLALNDRVESISKNFLVNS